MNPFSRPEDPLDSLLRRWRDANALSPSEARGIRDRAVGRAVRSEAPFDPAWWRACLGAGLRPLREAMNPARFAFPKHGFSFPALVTDPMVKLT
jgi:hypothetical protein